MFCAQSQVYTRFTGEVSTLDHHSPCELTCEVHIFLDQAMQEFIHTLDSIIMGPNETLESDAFFDQHDSIASLVCSGFLHSVPFLIALS